EFDSELNHTHIRQQLGARSIIPAKRGKKTWRINGVRAEMRDHFPRRLYSRRAPVETIFSATKRNLSCRARGRCLLTQRRQSLAAGSYVQLLSPVARNSVPQDVNRTKPALVSDRAQSTTSVISSFCLAPST